MLDEVNSLELTQVPRESLDWLADVISENMCTIKDMTWHSKYNNYVVYDYEPFCSEGFIIHIVIAGAYSKLKFIQYLYDNHISAMGHLNACYDLPSKSNKPKFLHM